MSFHSVKKPLQILAVIFFLSLIVYHFISHRGELSILKSIRIFDIAILFLILTCIYFMHAINVQLTLKKVGLTHIRLLDWLKLFIISRYINFHITQGRVIYLGYKLKKDHFLPYTSTISAMVYLTWFYTFNTFLFCSMLISLPSNNMAVSSYHIQISLIATSITIIILPFFLKMILSRISFKHRTLQWLAQKFKDLTSKWRDIVCDYRLFIKMAFLNLLILILYLLVVHTSFYALSIPISLRNASLFTVVLLVSKYYNIIPNNLGLTEMFCGYLSETLGGKMSDGIIVSGIIRIVEYLLITFLGILCAGSFIPKFPKAPLHE